MDSQEGIDEVYSLDYFDRTNIVGDINNRSKKPYQNRTCAGIRRIEFLPKVRETFGLIGFFSNF